MNEITHIQTEVIGKHVLANFHGVDPVILNDPEILLHWMVESIKFSGATYVGELVKQFKCRETGKPLGVTILILLAESHISCHSYPEHGYAMLDYFTCGDHCDPEQGMKHLSDLMKPKHTIIQVIDRERLINF